MVRSISKSPKDSISLYIPSLSLSKSTLSTTPSLSKSFGQMLTLTAEYNTVWRQAFDHNFEATRSKGVGSIFRTVR